MECQLIFQWIRKTIRILMILFQCLKKLACILNARIVDFSPKQSVFEEWAEQQLPVEYYFHFSVYVIFLC